MIRIERLSTFANEGTGRAQTVFRAVAAQPGWITRIALTAFILVIGLPILLLFLFALLAAIIIFALLAVVNAFVMAVRGVVLRRSDGRENVRVIRRA